jgi:UDP-N-acetylmuramate dehydrogenase
MKNCMFGYRDSIFKNKVKGKYIIISVTFRLTKKDHNIRQITVLFSRLLRKWGLQYVTINDVSNAVIKIRKEKLPDPAELGNSGSFFKNPVITSDHLEALKSQHPDIPFYEVGS